MLIEGQAYLRSHCVKFVSKGNEMIYGNSLFMEHGFALHIQSIINILKATVLGVIEFGAVI